MNILVIGKSLLGHYIWCNLSLPVEQVRSMGNQIARESRVVFLQHMRNTNTDTSVNTLNLRGFMDEVSVHAGIERIYSNIMHIFYVAYICVLSGMFVWSSHHFRYQIKHKWRQ